VQIIEKTVVKNQPFVMIKLVYNTVYAIGGLFQDGSDAQPVAKRGLQLARDIARRLDEALPATHGKRFAIALATGGPFLCGRVGRQNLAFEVAGAPLGVVAELSISSPTEGVIMSRSFMDAIGDVDVAFKRGPDVLGAATYHL